MMQIIMKKGLTNPLWAYYFTILGNTQSNCVE